MWTIIINYVKSFAITKALDYVKAIIFKKKDKTETCDKCKDHK